MTSTDFRYVVSNHSEFLHPYAISLTNNYEDAKDLYQETLLKALLNSDKYQFGTNLKAWLYTIMRNIFINSYRRNKKFTKINNEKVSEAILLETGSVSNEGWANLRMKEIKSAINELPKALQLSFELYYTGYKYQEIAEVLKEPLGTIKSRIHFARKMLINRIER